MPSHPRVSQACVPSVPQHRRLSLAETSTGGVLLPAAAVPFCTRVSAETCSEHSARVNICIHTHAMAAQARSTNLVGGAKLSRFVSLGGAIQLFSAIRAALSSKESFSVLSVECQTCMLGGGH